MVEKSKSLFADFAARPEDHFRIYFFGSVLNLIEGVSSTLGSFEQAVEKFPFLVGYNNELAERLAGLSSSEAQVRWCESLTEWERGVSGHLPLRALRLAAGLSHAELMWLLTPGLVEEDARYGAVFETLQGTPGQRRPTVGFLRHCAPSSEWESNGINLLSRMAELGALTVMNPDAPRQEQVFRFPNLVWDALRGGQFFSSAGVRHVAAAELPRLEDLILAPEARAQVLALPGLLREGAARTVVVRGPRHNGRRTVLGAVARELGRGLIEFTPSDGAALSLRPEAGALAVLLHALPVVELAPGPGEAAALPALEPASVPLGVVLNSTGGVAGARADQAIFLQLDLPGDHSQNQKLTMAVPSPRGRR